MKNKKIFTKIVIVIVTLATVCASFVFPTFASESYTEVSKENIKTTLSIGGYSANWSYGNNTNHTKVEQTYTFGVGEANLQDVTVNENGCLTNIICTLDKNYITDTFAVFYYYLDVKIAIL